MSTVFEFRRRRVKDGPTAAAIGPKGCASAREVGKLQLRGRKFDAFFASDYWRTQQTLAVFGEGAADFIMKFAPKTPPIYDQTDEVWKMWKTCREAEKPGEDIVQATITRARDAAPVSSASKGIARLFLDWAWRIGPRGQGAHRRPQPADRTWHTDSTARSCPASRNARASASSRRTGSDAHGPWTPSISADRASPDLDPSEIRKTLFS